MLISFIVPVYNAEAYLEECVESLLQQTYNQIEVLLVNDGSTDGSADLCDSFAAKDSRVRVFHKENGGVHTARNLGIHEAKGDYLMLVDADDWIDKETIARAVEVIHRDAPDIVRFTYVRELEHAASPKYNTFVKEGLSVGEECQKVFRQTMGLIGAEWAHPENFNFLAASWTSVIKKALIVDHNVEFLPRDPVGSFEDGLFNLKLMRHVSRFYYLNEPFYHYRKTNVAACTANYRKDYLKKQCYLFEQLMQIAEEGNDPLLKDAFYNRVVFSNLELCLNVLKSNHGAAVQYGEIREILNNSLHRQAADYICLKHYSLKWKIYFFFIKYRMTLFVYLMTKAIRFLQKRG